VIYCAARLETRGWKSGLVLLLVVTGRQAASKSVQPKSKMKSSNDKISGAGAGAGAVKRRKAGKAASVPTVQPVTVPTVPTVQPASNPLAMVVWAGSCIWGRSSVDRAQALRRFRVGRIIWRQQAAAAAAAAAAGRAVLAAWQASRVAFWAVQPASVPTVPTVQPASVGGGGGLVSMAAGFAGFDCSRRAAAVGLQSIGDLLRGCEVPAGPILKQVQLDLDLALVQSLAHKLNRKMVGDGRESCFLRDGSSGAEFGAFSWSVSMLEACNDATAALVRYRAGYGLGRDDSGGVVLTLGDDLGNACGVWMKGFGKGFKGDFIPAMATAKQFAAAVEKGFSGVGLVAGYRFSASSARIVWRSLVDSIKDDNLGTSAATQAAAADFYAWAAAVGGDWSQLKQAVLIEQRDKRRLAILDSTFEQMAAGRGKRKGFAARSKQATVLMLSGMPGEQACAAAGFKASAGRSGSGAVSSCNRFAVALRRAGYPVVFKRGNFAQDCLEVDEVKAAQKRGGAVRDLATLFSFSGVSRECAKIVHPQTWGGLSGATCGRSCILAARVRNALGRGLRSGDSLMRRVARRVQPVTVPTVPTVQPVSGRGAAAAAAVRSVKS